MHESGLELLAMYPGIGPFARCCYPFAGGDGGGVPDDRDLVTVSAGLEPQHAESVLCIMDGHPLDGPRQGSHLLTARACVPLS